MSDRIEVEKVDGEWPEWAVIKIGESIWGEVEPSGFAIRRHRFPWEQIALEALDALASED